jgi:yecA family protein
MKTELTEDELENLHNWISHYIHDGVKLSLSYLHGLFVAVVSSPNTVDLQKCQALLNLEDNAHIIQEPFITDLLIKFFQIVENQLLGDDFIPLLYESPDEVFDPTMLASEWCAGYLRGAALDQDWSILLDIELLNQYSYLIYPYISLMNVPSTDSIIAKVENIDDEEIDRLMVEDIYMKEELIKCLKNANEMFYRFWRLGEQSPFYDLVSRFKDKRNTNN